MVKRTDMQCVQVEAVALAAAVALGDHVTVPYPVAFSEKSVATNATGQALLNIKSAKAKVFILAPRLCVGDARAQVNFYVESVREQVRLTVRDATARDT